MNIYDRRSPVLNDICAEIRKLGKADTEIAHKAGLSKTTINNIMSGKTKSPHFKTIEFMLEAAGMQLVTAEYQRRNFLRRVK